MAFFQRPDEQASRDTSIDRLAQMREAAKTSGLPIHVQTAVDKEIARLELIDPAVADYSTGLNYLDCVLSLPWNSSTPDNLDLGHAQMFLDEEHFGLSRVKDRVLEYLASRVMIGRRPSKILIVDDEEVARSNLTRVFGKEGYRADSAANGLDALHMAESGHYDLIMTDLKMDKMDGLTLLEKVKTVSPATEVMLITGFASVDTAVSAFKKGAIHYFSKPVNLDELRAGVASILDAKRRVSLSRGPILCFSGPPGTGKTSIGRSLARSMGRPFIRFSLAGLRDEMILLGQRRTDATSMPGKIIGELRRCGYNNPVFMIDDVDKIAPDFHGDPASVLLEIIDPEQNSHFLDHFLDLSFDLSRVMFILTTNIAERLPRALFDRLEVVSFASYTLAEKRHIARGHILPRELEGNGLPHDYVIFKDKALDTVISNYTREAGLRNLERELALICRRLDRIILSGATSLPLTIDDEFIRKLLGPPTFTHDAAHENNKVGVTTGLVWTEFGGDIIFVECLRMKGKGELILTGSLAEPLREYAQSALSHIRANASTFGIDPDFFSGQDFHIHISGEASPKDGSSTGMTFAMALLSLLSNRPARRTSAMSGEINLSGELFPVLAVREKILAASRSGANVVVFPENNRQDVESVEPEALEGLQVLFVKSLDELAGLILV